MREKFSPENSINKVRIWQNLCGWIFSLVFLCNIACIYLLRAHILSYSQSWFIYSLGIGATLGFLLLVYLASNLVAEIFASCMLGIEFTLSLIEPKILPHVADDFLYYRVVLYICMALCVTAIYLWTVLMNDSNIGRNKWWLVLLPSTYLFNFCMYFGQISLVHGHTGIISVRIFNTPTFSYILTCILLYNIIGFWKLSHSDMFSKQENLKYTSSMSPFNFYTLGYAILLIVGLLLF